MERREGTESRPSVNEATEPNFALGTLEIDRRDLREVTGVGLDEGQLAEIVHDLRGPLATVALEVTLLDQRINEGDIVDARPVLARVLQNVEFLDRLLQDVLDGCAPDVALQLKPTDMRSLLEVVIARSVPTRQRARVRLEAPRSAIVSIDELRIQRVVANLLSNALKYSSPKTIITVRLDVGRDHCCVSVVDTGPGVSQAEAGYIFDKYRRTHSARIHPGSGLGLYVSRKIIEHHGGLIGVDSTPGVGSRFFFQLALS